MSQQLPPDKALTGSVAGYIASLEPSYQAPVCVIGLRLLASQRGAYCEDGAVLQALAKMELELVQVHSTLQSPGPIREVFGMPPA